MRLGLCGASAVFVSAFVSVAAFGQDQPPATEVATIEGEATPVLEVVLTPRAQAMKDALEEAKAEEELFAFYEANDFETIWTQPKRMALLDALGAAHDHGLPEDHYDTETLRAILIDPAISAPDADLAASRAFLIYAREIGTGLLEPRSVDRDIVIKRPPLDVAAVMGEMAKTANPSFVLAGLAPKHPDYSKLLGEKRRLETLILTGGWGEDVPSGKSLKPGAVSPRITSLRARLERMESRAYGESDTYDEELVEAVKTFQLRHGLNDDGVVGPATLAAINADPEDRLKQVLVNLERQRWLNLERGKRHIYVNQADFSVSVIDDGKVTFWSRTVIGKNKHRSQEFNDEMTHMVVNPTWNVPRSIATEEMLPKLRRNPGSLGGSMQIMTRNGTVVNPKYVDFSQFNKRNFPFIIKQRPGSRNALGKVKFMFPNQFHIYLHDTPSKSLFNRDVRAFSHGCIRVHKPFELAYALLAPQSEDPKALFRSYLNSGRERQLNLKTPVPIYLTYQSAWVDEDGVPQFRGDVYGRDQRVFRALEKVGVTLPKVDG
ncbi:L,D-transpeptidase family protein [Halovulum sp. GXIMD14793]